MSAASEAGAAGRPRRWWPLVAGVVVVGVAIGGLVAPRVVRSPADLAADRAAPELPPATAVVEHRVLTATVTVRGTVTSERRADVTAVAAAGGQAVVTGVRVNAGERVRSGDVLVEVSGRPVVLLEGRLPPYRDLRTGARGPDVGQLQSALRGLGLRITDADEEFGPSTTAAVRRFYADRGYDPPDAGEGAPGTGTADGPPLVADDARAPDRVTLPLAEVVYLAGLPGRVDRLAASLGERPTDALMVVSSGRGVVTATLPPGDRDLVREGQPARIVSEVLGTSLRGTVASVGRLEAGEGAPGHPLRVRPRAAMDPRLFDQDVRVTIEAARTDGKVLVVPLSALSARADGSSVVSVVADDGEVRTVPVRLGLDAGGYVAVRPDGRSARLEPGDRVIVGVAPQAAS